MYGFLHALKHGQCCGSNAAGASKDYDLLHAKISRRMRNTGTVDIIESMLSSIPPLPGITFPESFTPADLLKRLSTRSPRFAVMLTQSPSRMLGIIEIDSKMNRHSRMESNVQHTAPPMN